MINDNDSTVANCGDPLFRALSDHSYYYQYGTGHKKPTKVIVKCLLERFAESQYSCKFMWNSLVISRLSTVQ